LDKLAKVSPEYDNTTFRYVSHDISHPEAPFNWTSGTRFSLKYISWPPKGVALHVHFRLQNTDELGLVDSLGARFLKVTMHYEMYDDELGLVDSLGARFLKVTMHYEMYDGIPVMAKWMTIDAVDDHNGRVNAMMDVKLSSVTVEMVASYPPYGAYFLVGQVFQWIIRVWHR
jgi:hypothetical protein